MMTQNRMLACYYPTTVILVDDDNDYLQSIGSILDTRFADYELYDSPAQALEFLKDRYHSNPFVNRCLLRPEEEALDHRILDVDVRRIHKEIYNKNRFKEVSVIVVDYSMPSMDGLQFCEQFKAMPIKKILLTGYADEQLAVRAFNSRIIDKFIRKEEHDFSKIINTSVHDLQREYFQYLSEIIINSLVNNIESPTAVLSDQAFIRLFDKIYSKYKGCEYYLMDSSGSYLILDFEGNPVWLVVKSEEEMRDYCELAMMADAPQNIIDALTNRSQIPYFYSDEEQQKSPQDWSAYMHPAQQLSGEDIYYYAVIDQPSAYSIEAEKILSYKTFLSE